MLKLHPCQQGLVSLSQHALRLHSRGGVLLASYDKFSTQNKHLLANLTCSLTLPASTGGRSRSSAVKILVASHSDLFVLDLNSGV